MTVKQISDLTGVTEKTIRKHIEKLFPGKMRRGIETKLNKQESEQVLFSIPKKGILQVGKTTEETGTSTDVSQLEKAIVSMNNLAGAIMANVQIQNQRIKALEDKFTARVDALPAPEISPRNQINRIVRDYAERENRVYRDVWDSLYIDFGYRMNKNYRQCAKNREIRTIEYIEKEGDIGELLATARELFK